MLPKENRIYNDKEIQATLKSRFRYQILDLQIILYKNQQAKFKALIVVSKKISKKAVQRNTVRRRLIALFETAKYNQTLISGWNCMMIVKDKAILDRIILVEYKDLISFINTKISSLINNPNSFQPKKRFPSGQNPKFRKS